MEVTRNIGDAAFAAVVRGSLDAIIVGDEDGRVIEFNPAAERLFGWSRKEALSRSITELIVPPHLRERHEAGMERMRAGDPPRLTERRVEVEAMRRGGEIFRCELSVARLHLEGPPLFAASIRDLTPLKEEQDARRSVEELLRAIFDDQTEVIFRYDADMRIVFYNEAACRLYGVTPTGMMGRHFLEDVDPSARERLASDLAALTPEAAVCIATDPKELPNGNFLWIEWTNRALFDDQGQLTGYQAVGRDVTEQVEGQIALDASEKRFAAFMRHAPVGMYIKDSDGRYVDANPEMEKVFQQPTKAVIGQKAADLMPQGLAEEIQAADDKVRETGLASAIEEHIPDAEAYEWTLVVRFPIEQGHGTPAHIGGFDIDITSQKRAEIEVARAREALHQSEKLKALGSFAAGVAHELNNPLAILAGQAELLAEDTAGGPLEARGEKIRRAANRCARTVRSFLAMARHDPPERRPVDVNALIDLALDLASWTLNASNVSVERDYTASVPIIVGDPDQLHQVVLNLLLNAQQAMEDWPKERAIKIATSFDLEKNAVRIVLEDTGPGIPEDQQPQIFQPFFTTRSAGIGIGLAYCRRVIEAHGGNIALGDTADGASFTLVLPIDVTFEVADESQP